MQNTTIAAIAVAVVLATAPQVFAFGGGGGHRGGGGSVSGSSVPVTSGGSTTTLGTGGTTGGTTSGGSPLSAPEPFAALAVGLGLLGARLLRRP